MKLTFKKCVTPSGIKALLDIGEISLIVSPEITAEELIEIIGQKIEMSEDVVKAYTKRVEDLKSFYEDLVLNKSFIEREIVE